MPSERKGLSYRQPSTGLESYSRLQTLCYFLFKTNPLNLTTRAVLLFLDCCSVEQWNVHAHQGAQPWNVIKLETQITRRARFVCEILAMREDDARFLQFCMHFNFVHFRRWSYETLIFMTLNNSMVLSTKSIKVCHPKCLVFEQGLDDLFRDFSLPVFASRFMSCD